MALLALVCTAPVAQAFGAHVISFMIDAARADGQLSAGRRGEKEIEL
jgi:uncharacterized membrane protein YebE (DUF533 family)